MTRRSKQGNNEGSIYKDARGLWRAAISVGDVEGKPKRKYLSGKTRKEVHDKMVKLQRDIQQGIPVVSGRETVGKYLRHWQEHSLKPTVRESTYRSYRSHIANHLIPRSGY